MRCDRGIPEARPTKPIALWDSIDPVAALMHSNVAAFAKHNLVRLVACPVTADRTQRRHRVGRERERVDEVIPPQRNVLRSVYKVRLVRVVMVAVYVHECSGGGGRRTPLRSAFCGGAGVSRPPTFPHVNCEDISFRERGGCLAAVGVSALTLGGTLLLSCRCEVRKYVGLRFVALRGSSLLFRNDLSYVLEQ